MEQLYLQFSFNTHPLMMRGTELVKTASADGQLAAVPGLRNKLEQSLLVVTDTLLSCYSPDVSGTFVQVRLSIRGVIALTKCLVILISPLQSESTPPECLVRCLSLMTGVLAAYVSTGFLNEKEACYSQLFTKAKVSNASQCIKM